MRQCSVPWVGSSVPSQAGMSPSASAGAWGQLQVLSLCPLSPGSLGGSTCPHYNPPPPLLALWELATDPVAGNEKFKLFPENSEITSTLSSKEQKEQGNVFFPFIRTNHSHGPVMPKIEAFPSSQMPRPITAMVWSGTPPPASSQHFSKYSNDKFGAGLKNPSTSQAIVFTYFRTNLC